MYLQRWHGWCHMKLLPSRRVLCTPYNHAPCHFMQSHIRKVHACLAVTCHLHFWQNGRGLLRATVVTRGWNGYPHMSQHRKSTLEKKILPPLLQRFKPATFQFRVRRSNHWAIAAPHHGTDARGYWIFLYIFFTALRVLTAPLEQQQLCVFVKHDNEAVSLPHCKHRRKNETGKDWLKKLIINALSAIKVVLQRDRGVGDKEREADNWGDRRGGGGKKREL